MATDLETVLLTAIIGVIVFVGYVLYNRYKKQELTEILPEYRDKPMVIGEDGAKIVIEKTPSGPYKTRYKFEDGSIKYYHHRGDYHDLVETSIEQDHLGVNRPVLMERAFMLRHAYKDRRVGLQYVNDILEGVRTGVMRNNQLTPDEIKEMLGMIQHTDKLLKETPLIGQEAVEQYGRAQQESSRAESELQKKEQGRQGDVARRLGEIHKFLKTDTERSDGDKRRA